MDKFIVFIDVLVVLLYIGLIFLISPYMMQFLRNKNCDIFFQLIPVLSFIVISSVIISISYGGFQETLFFKLISILSTTLLIGLLFLTLLMKNVWPEKYETLLIKLSFSKNKRLSS